MDKYIGRLLDNRYEILEVLGTGGMAVVYKARCHKLNRYVAIKILKDDYLEDEEFRRRFHSESQAVAQLSHPNIVSVYDVSTSIMMDYIVMELIDGITLKQYMEKKGVLNWKETLHFAIQIAKALEHAHSRGIVHRDIKPHNVMVLKNGSVKVTDFGIARMMSKGNTLTKEALGSVHYISPEQAKGGRVDNRSDIYSLGVVMYEMMSGRPPYDGESPVAVAIQHINGGAVMPSTLNPNIPGGLEQIIMHAMAHEPESRYNTATQMLKDMDEFRKDPGILFDYNIPPLDEVIRINKPPLVLNPEPVTTAQKVEQKKTHTEQPRRRPAKSSAAPVRRHSAEKEEERRSNVATIAIISCSAVMVIAIVIFLVVLLSGPGVQSQLVEVPSLVGKVYDDLPEYADFQVQRNEEVYDENYPAGQIIKQKPEAGEQLAKGETIYVWVSLGPAKETVTMPGVIDWELSQAKRALDNLSMNLQVVEIEENSSEIAKGSVIRSDPEEGALLTAGQMVTLYVSLGKEAIPMPDLINSSMDDAIKELKALNLDLKFEEEAEFDEEISFGNVIRTNPEEGVKLIPGQTVILYVRRLIEIWDVEGMRLDHLTSTLQKAGFTEEPKIQKVENDSAENTVLYLQEGDTRLLEGDYVNMNTKLTIVVSSGVVTKDVTIQLGDVAAINPVEITVSRNGQNIHKEQVSVGTTEITIEDQFPYNSKTATYKLTTGDGTEWEVTVNIE